MNTLTPSQIKDLEATFRGIAYEHIQVVQYTDKAYALGSELAVRRLAMHFKSFEVGCSSYFASEHGQGWYYDFTAYTA